MMIAAGELPGRSRPGFSLEFPPAPLLRERLAASQNSPGHHSPSLPSGRKIMVSLPLHALEAAAMAFSGRNIAVIVGMAAVAVVASRGADEIFKWLEKDERPWAAISDGR